MLIASDEELGVRLDAHVLRGLEPSELAKMFSQFRDEFRGSLQHNQVTVRFSDLIGDFSLNVIRLNFVFLS